MPIILLSTINARYAHASLGLRYLLANLGDLRSETQILEFVSGTRPIDIAENILQQNPQIIGFGVYLWNIEETTQVVGLLKTIRPELKIVLGGPEVSYEWEQQTIVRLADHVITGWGDISFPKLCRQLLQGPPPPMKIIPGEQPPLSDIQLPYHEYTDEDIAKRFLYVEASRGCPYKCEFCLSALDKTAWAFALDPFLLELEKLWQRGARHFRFVDRTFNLSPKTTLPILRFFLSHLEATPQTPLFVHFELVPDHLPDSLKEVITHFPSGVLQFEIGIQTLNPTVQSLISRRQDNVKALENIQWLRTHSTVHLHADLIVGLPGESLASFAAGFDQLIATQPHEIQVGILKRLRGAPIDRHTKTFQMRYNPNPPYNVLSTDQLDFSTIQRMNRFARYWDLIANSGRFQHSLPLLLANNPFDNFLNFSDWLFARTQQTHQLALEKLFDAIYNWLSTRIDAEVAKARLLEDYLRTGAKGRLSFMDKGLTVEVGNAPKSRKLRQERHVSTNMITETL